MYEYVYSHHMCITTMYELIKISLSILFHYFKLQHFFAYFKREFKIKNGSANF